MTTHFPLLAQKLLDEVKLSLRLKSLLQTYKIIHDRSLSYLGTETSIKSDEIKSKLKTQNI